MTLMYHNLSDAGEGVYRVGWKEFGLQLGWLQSEGYVIEGFDGLQNRLLTGFWPERYLVMTFDDGYSSHLRAAAVLSQAGAEATFFLTKSYCDSSPEFLGRQEIRELASMCDVGSHSVSHPYMAKLRKQQIHQELADSKSWLEDLTGREITAFSIPNGSTNATVVRLAKAAGYTLIGGSVEWWNTPSQVALERVVRRIAIRSTFSLNSFTTIVRRNRLFLSTRALRSCLLAIPKTLLPAPAIRSLRTFLRIR